MCFVFDLSPLSPPPHLPKSIICQHPPGIQERATHAHPLHPAALASVPNGKVLVRVRVQVPGVARAVVINGTCVLVNVFISGSAWWGEGKLVVKLIIRRGGGGGGSGEASWGTSGPVRITGRELVSMATPRKVFFTFRLLSAPCGLKRVAHSMLIRFHGLRELRFNSKLRRIGDASSFHFRAPSGCFGLRRRPKFGGKGKVFFWGG
jgi:hypothetical protein